MEPRRSNASHTPSAPASPASILTGKGSGNNILSTVLTVLLILATIVAIAYFGTRLAAGTTGGAVKGKQYQAIFLTNGQVYFGKLKSVDSSYLKLTDIYYLQVQQTVQPDQQKQENQNQQPNVSLAKLGSELHGPEDTMYISRDQVLFWENLKEDGKVTQAIKDYQSGGNKQ